MATDEQLLLRTSLEGVGGYHKTDTSTWNEDLYSNILHTKAWYREEIKKLKAEISVLSDSFKEDKIWMVGTTSKHVSLLENLTTKLPEDKQSLLEGVDIKGNHNAGGDIDVKWLELFTGFSIEDIGVNVSDQAEDNIIRRKHYLCGSCYDVQFELTFLVEERGSEEERTGKDETSDCQESCVENKHPKITDLIINVNNEQASFDMRNLLARVQEEQQLQQFFSTLQTYSKLRSQRLKTFHHFTQKYPELVLSLSDESILTICNTNYPSIRFNIVWKIAVTEEGQATTMFDLSSAIPTRPNKQDSTGLLKKLRSKFSNLLKTIGIEKSIDIIINVIAK